MKKKSSLSQIVSRLTVAVVALLFGCNLSHARHEEPSKTNSSIRTDNHKNILVLNSYHEGYLWTDRVMESVKAVFDSVGNTELFINYMDTKRHADSIYFDQLYQLYAKKYATIKFDAILSSDDHALNFLLQYRDILFPEVPVAFCGINDFKPERLNSHSGYTGIYEHYDVGGTIDLIKTFQPNVQNIVFISDVTVTGDIFKANFETAIIKFTDRIQFQTHHNRSLNFLCDTLSKLPENSAIIWGSYLRTPDQGVISAEESIKQISICSQVPLYCVWDIVGEGVVGGKITSPYYQGKEASQLILRFFEGESPDDIPVTTSPMEYKIDYNLLKKFNFRLDDIPSESIVINKEPSIYQTYKKAIWIASGIIYLLSLIIIILIYLIRKRRQAEYLLRHKNTALIESSQKLEEAKFKAEESDRLKSIFLSNLSHEIRTPMNGILGFANLLTTKELSPKNQKEYLTMIKKSGERLLSLITDLVDISKIDAGELVLELEATSMNDFMENIFQRFVLDAKEKELEFSLIVDNQEKELTVLIDSYKLEQALDNILKNALKFTKTGSIEFGCKPTEDDIQFWVKDTGPGIPEQDHEAIFERFRQVEDTAFREEEGSGIGLSITSDLIKLMNGTIWLESVFGEGSCFYLSIPFIPAPEALVTQPNSQKTDQQIDKIKILVAEDDDISFELLDAIINMYDIHVIRAKNGEEAVNITKESKNIGLILMDMKMPQMNGLDAVKNIRSFNTTIPIIAQTAHISDKNNKLAIDAGCDDFISKPIQLTTIQRIIKQYLQLESTK